MTVFAKQKILLINILIFLLMILFFPLPKEVMVMTIFSLFFLAFMSFGGDEYAIFFFVDNLSYSMILLSLLLMAMVILVAMESSMLKMFLLSLSLVIVVVFFMMFNVFLFFILFEFSLLPVFLIIMLWGNQPERLKAVMFMMMFTFVASSPFLFSILFFFSNGSLSIYDYGEMSNKIICLFLILAFWVKVPMYLFHSWLPKAHVEAPLEGSMILAGIMLKVGVYGLIRIFMWFEEKWIQELYFFSFSFGLIGSLMAVVVAMSSDDMKMSVAFSSISHMNLCISSMSCMKESSLESCILVMISHGLCSPMLFFLVTEIYKFSGSRSLVISKGVMSKFPMFQFFSFLIWSMNISVPPFLSFIGEIQFFSCIYSFYWISVVLVSTYLVMSSFFSMFNFGTEFHSSSKLEIKKSIKLMTFSLFSSFVCVVMVILFFSFDFFF